MSKFDGFDDNDFLENEEQKDSSYLSDELQEQLASIRKKDRIKMMVLGFAAGLMVAVGAGIYISDAKADSTIDYANYSSGYTSGVEGSYADYNSGATDSAGALGAGGGGCCGGGAGGAATDSASLADLEKQALDEYKKENNAEPDVTAKANNYGCHIQIDISDKSGKIIRSYGYQGSSLYVIK